MNGTRSVIKPEMKCTSRERRSSFATTIGATLKSSSLISFAGLERCLELWPTLKRVALGAFNLDEALDDEEALGFAEALDGLDVAPRAPGPSGPAASCSLSRTQWPA